MMTKNFGIGNPGKNLFNKETNNLFQDEWLKTTNNSENFEIMNHKVKSMKTDNVSIEDIEALCEKWWMKSTEDKLIFVEKLNLYFENKMSKNGYLGYIFGFDSM